MTLKYHQRTLDLLRIEPVVSDEARQRLTALEARRGLKLPASLREFYALQDSTKWLIGNDDHIMPLSLVSSDDEAGRLHWPRVWKDSDVFLPDDMLVIIIENQGVCIWAVKLNGSDDPPVFIRENEPGYIWQFCAPTFSEFVFLWVWDHQHEFKHGMPISVHKPLTSSTMSFLRKYYVELPSNIVWPDALAHRFIVDDGSIMIMQQNAHCVWRFWADSPESLLQALHILRERADSITHPAWEIPDLPDLDEARRRIEERGRTSE